MTAAGRSSLDTTARCLATINLVFKEGEDEGVGSVDLFAALHLHNQTLNAIFARIMLA